MWPGCKERKADCSSAPVVFDMDAIGVDADRQFWIVRDEASNAMLLQEGSERAKDLLFRAFAARGAVRNKHASDVARRDRRLEKGRISGPIGNRRRDQIKTRRVHWHGQKQLQQNFVFNLIGYCAGFMQETRDMILKKFAIFREIYEANQ